MRISLIIPFKNELSYAQLTMDTALEFLINNELEFELIAVDDSVDGTWEILNKFAETHDSVIAVKGDPRGGYGRALRKGFSVASGDVLIPFNGDLCDSLDDVQAYVELIQSGYDMVFGSRFMEGATVIGQVHAKGMVSRLGNRFIQLLFRADCDDTTNSFKAYKRTVIENIQPGASGFNINIEVALKGIRKGFRYTTIPVTWKERQFGRSKMSVLKVLLTYLSTAVMIRVDADARIK